MHIPFAAGASYPVRAGNRVRPLIGGESAFRRICEAVEAAEASVWVTVAFLTPKLSMPDGFGSVFDVLDRAVARGLDVRVLFWRPNPEVGTAGAGAFAGLPDELDELRARGSRFRARWDRARKAWCQHRKSWLVDAGKASETAFVGGINPTSVALRPPGPEGEYPSHDIYVEVTGPSATDVHHNFVQRWNEASERGSDDGVWGRDDLAFPAHASGTKGESLVQIQRTVHAGLYSDGRPTPFGQTYDIANGEFSIFEQYGRAIDAARDFIYIENQAFAAAPILAALERALTRGVAVVALVPAEPEALAEAQGPEARGRLDRMAALGRFERFTLAGIAGPGADGSRTNIYVHAKVMLIDDVWATIGSCNLRPRSFFGHTEMNATVGDPEVVRALRCRLFSQHLGQSAVRDGPEACARFRGIARANYAKAEYAKAEYAKAEYAKAEYARAECARADRGDVAWQGRAFSLDPAGYGRQ